VQFRTTTFHPLFKVIPQPGVRCNATTNTQPVTSTLLQCLLTLGHKNIDCGCLKARRDIRNTLRTQTLRLPA